MTVVLSISQLLLRTPLEPSKAMRTIRLRPRMLRLVNDSLTWRVEAGVPTRYGDSICAC
jgi:hypothetical protein